jgi:aminoglycoside 6'-N-acetyltransferase I
MPSDVASLAHLAHKLWPDADEGELRGEYASLLAGERRSTLPLTLFVAEAFERVVGFVEVGLRSHADGCDPSRPCGFIEGWYVEAEFRMKGVGRALAGRAEAWCREQGCKEMASDTWVDNPGSVSAHSALGYEVVDRCVHLRKQL